jgi:hypothetical protein
VNDFRVHDTNIHVVHTKMPLKTLRNSSGRGGSTEDTENTVVKRAEVVLHMKRDHIGSKYSRVPWSKWVENEHFPLEEVTEMLSELLEISTNTMSGAVASCSKNSVIYSRS